MLPVLLSLVLVLAGICGIEMKKLKVLIAVLDVEDPGSSGKPFWVRTYGERLHQNSRKARLRLICG